MGSDASIQSEDLTPGERIEVMARQTRQAYPPVPQSPADDGRVAQLEAKVLGLSTSLAELLEDRAEEALAEPGVGTGGPSIDVLDHEFHSGADGRMLIGDKIEYPFTPGTQIAQPFIAYEDWTNTPAGTATPYIMCHGCDDLDGANEDAVQHKIYLPRHAHRLGDTKERLEPNVVDNDTLMAIPLGDDWVAVTPYLDGWFGKVVMDRNTVATGAPPGWRLYDMAARMPVGYDGSGSPDPDFDVVEETHGAATHTHAEEAAHQHAAAGNHTHTGDGLHEHSIPASHTHSIATVLCNLDQSGTPADQISVASETGTVTGGAFDTFEGADVAHDHGAAGSHQHTSAGAHTHDEVSNYPPYKVMRFFERYDNSKV